MKKRQYRRKARRVRHARNDFRFKFPTSADRVLQAESSLERQIILSLEWHEQAAQHLFYSQQPRITYKDASGVRRYYAPDHRTDSDVE